MATAAHHFPHFPTTAPTPRRRVSAKSFASSLKKHPILYPTAVMTLGMLGFLGKTAVNARNHYDSELTSIARTPPNLSANLIVIETGAPKRIEYGVELWLQNQLKNPELKQKLLITGVDAKLGSHNAYQIFIELCKNDGMDSATLAQLASHIRPNQIYLGFGGLTTEGNAIETNQFLSQNGIKPVILDITSKFHVPRSNFEMSHALGGRLSISFITPEHCHNASPLRRWHEITETYWREHGGRSLKTAYRKPTVGQALVAVELPRPQSALAANVPPQPQPPF